MKFNTAIATLMAVVNDFYANGASRGDMKALLLMLSPFAPTCVRSCGDGGLRRPGVPAVLAHL